ncbi:MAG: hypothetical protein ABIS67_06675, partial [Candidatus Eisenbacteria bacterium]
MAIEPIRDAADQAAKPPSSPASFPLSSSGLRPLDETLDPDEFERRLLALALSPEGASAARAWIVRRAESGDIEWTLAAPAAPGTNADARAKRTIDPAGSGGALAEAWRDARVVWSREPDSGTP